ncbi:hypothetical protein R1sor_001710 [Riccia sorocarpa]|uniref:Uncharacterized protein n=1 Tax=Riccia sorocarpa TaxID=122646 RepID=A0ABD3GWQ0_9MARC
MDRHGNNADAFLLKNAAKLLQRDNEEWIPIAEAIILATLQRSRRPLEIKAWTVTHTLLGLKAFRTQGSTILDRMLRTWYKTKTKLSWKPDQGPHPNEGSPKFAAAVLHHTGTTDEEETDELLKIFKKARITNITQEILTLQDAKPLSNRTEEHLQTADHLLLYWKNQTTRWLQGATYKHPMTEDNSWEYTAPQVATHLLPSTLNTPWDPDYLIHCDQIDDGNNIRKTLRRRRRNIPERALHTALPINPETQSRLREATTSWLQGHCVNLQTATRDSQTQLTSTTSRALNGQPTNRLIT